MRKFFYFLILGLSLPVFSGELARKLNFTSIGQKDLPKEAFGTYPELNTWALFQGMTLQRDSKMQGIHDGICRMIPNAGLKFYLESEKELHKKIFLYLDLTTYTAKPDSRYPTRRLSVYIKGQLKKTVFFQPGLFQENPVEITVEPGLIEDGRINIELIPDYTEGGKFWGIWDAFYTFQKEKP